MKKFGLICMALVLALGALGIGYASWSDSIYIEGTVNTGTVDLETVGLSGTWLWKNLDTGESEYRYGFNVLPP